MDTNLLIVRVISPKGLLFSGLAESISSKNSMGDFDILPQHANFITIVENQPLLIRPPKKEMIKLDLTLSIIHASRNNVNIYTEIDLNQFDQKTIETGIRP